MSKSRPQPKPPKPQGKPKPRPKPRPGPPPRPAELPARPNLLLLITDQERAVQHWPDGWAEQNLPALARLRRHGLTFRNAFTNTCQCSPARATLFTGTYPAVHGVTRTSGTLASGFPNLARILGAAGYEVYLKGKWHLNTRYLSTQPDLAPGFDQGLAEDYGFLGWNAPDAGTSLNGLDALGGGTADNDRRFVLGTSPGEVEGIVDFLRLRRPAGGRGKPPQSGPPFCLVASLVNPHDVAVYPRLVGPAGYDPAAFAALPIDLPANLDDDLAGKPAVQAWFRDASPRFLGALGSDEARLEYVRFYAYLHTLTDALIGQILDALDETGLTESTLVVRLSDHGEMGLSHGLRQKVYTAYEEVLRVPLLVSHPGLYPQPVETDALAGLIDLLPTLAALAGVPDLGRWNLQGVDLSPVLRDPRAAVQEAIFYTFDDQLGPEPADPSHIRALRERDWKYALYFDPLFGKEQYELYDLKNDPLERQNLADDPRFAAERRRLDEALRQKMAATGATRERVAAVGALADPIQGPGVS
jgi:choline-sulfatase